MARILSCGAVIALAMTASITSIGASATGPPARANAHMPATPLAAVKLLACPAYSYLGTPKGCLRHSSGWVQPCHRGEKNGYPTWSPKNGCPITNRVRRRLLQNPTYGRGGGADPICRCQNTPPRMRFSVAKTSPGHAWMNAVYYWTPTAPTSITFVVVKQSHVWLVTDMYCTGRPMTTIYHSPVAPC